jgi:HEAT repeat protein
MKMRTQNAVCRLHKVRSVVAILALMGTGHVVAVGGDTTPFVQIPESAVDVLNSMEAVPDASDVERAFGNIDTLAKLIAISTAAPDLVDAGVQVRAIRALSKFAGGRATLQQLIAQPDLQTGIGSRSVMLRTAIESLGSFSKIDDVGQISAMLNFEASRDIRAAAARALGIIGSSSAVEPLRARFRKELSAQVRFEISKALQSLE